MTREEIENTPKIVDYVLSESLMSESKEKLHKRLDEICNLAIKALEQEPCEDCISRQEVLDYIYNDLGLGDEENGQDVERLMELERSYRYVKSLSSVTPVEKQEPKTGHWIMHIDDLFPEESTQECDVCHAEQSISITDDNYCPNCGAKMESEE